MPYISSMFTKEVSIPATSSGEKDCIETVNEADSIFGLILRQLRFNGRRADVELCPEILA